VGKGRPWLNLKYVDDKRMACTACTEFGEQNGMFVTAVLAVDDRHVTFCEYNGSVARIICVAVATLANKKLLERASDNDLLLCRKSTSNKTRYRQ
jgi:hypothetical protein